jgi:hypothetical protein
MNIDDPCLAYSPLQACNYIMACCAVVLIQGKNIKGLCLCHPTLMGYICHTLQLHRNQHLPNPQGALVNYISLMTNAVKKWELVPNRWEVIHDIVFHHMLCTSSSHNKDPLHAVATDWSLLDHYAGFCKSEWYQDSPCVHAHIMDLLWGDRSDSVALIAEDIILKDANVVHVPISLSTPASTIHHAEIPNQYQKNQDNYHVLTYSVALNTC